MVYEEVNSRSWRVTEDGFALGPLLLGPLSDRFGCGPVLLAGSLIFTLAGFGCALAQIFVARLLQGIGAGTGGILPFVIVQDLFEGHAARIYHVPITTLGWPDLGILESRLGTARDLWHEIVRAPFPNSWVPANNWYHPDHVRILKRALRELTTICGIFSTGEAEDGEYREFGPEPWEMSFLCLPRETFGFVLCGSVRLMMLPQIAGLDLWTHSVHPDDIYDIPHAGKDDIYHRNPERRVWRAVNDAGRPGLFQELDDWLGYVRSVFP